MRPRRAMRSGHHEHVAWRELYDALGDRAVQRASDEIAAATPDDDQIGGHLACDVDERDRRIAYRRMTLNRHVSSRRQELARFREQQVRIHCSTDQLGAEPCGTHLRRDGYLASRSEGHGEDSVEHRAAPLFVSL